MECNFSCIRSKIYTKVTDNDGIAMGHFGSIGYYLSVLVGKYVGNPER